MAALSLGITTALSTGAATLAYADDPVDSVQITIEGEGTTEYTAESLSLPACDDSPVAVSFPVGGPVTVRLCGNGPVAGIYAQVPKAGAFDVVVSGHNTVGLAEPGAPIPSLGVQGDQKVEAPPPWDDGGEDGEDEEFPPGNPAAIDVQGFLWIYGDTLNDLATIEEEVDNWLTVEAMDSNSPAIQAWELIIGTDPAVEKTAVVVDVVRGFAPAQFAPESIVTVNEGSFYFDFGGTEAPDGLFVLQMGGYVIMDSTNCLEGDDGEWSARDCNPFVMENQVAAGFTAERVDLENPDFPPNQWEAWEATATDGSWSISLMWLNHLSDANAPQGYNLGIRDGSSVEPLFLKGGGLVGVNIEDGSSIEAAQTDDPFRQGHSITVDDTDLNVPAPFLLIDGGTLKGGVFTGKHLSLTDTSIGSEDAFSPKGITADGLDFRNLEIYSVDTAVSG